MKFSNRTLIHRHPSSKVDIINSKFLSSLRLSSETSLPVPAHSTRKDDENQKSEPGLKDQGHEALKPETKLSSKSRRPFEDDAVVSKLSFEELKELKSVKNTPSNHSKRKQST